MLEEGECPYEDGADGEGAAGEDELQSGSEADGDALAAAGEPCEPPESFAVADVPAAAGMPCENHAPSLIGGEVSAEAAEYVTRSQAVISAFEAARDSFAAVGAMQAVVNMENEIRKERRRVRGMCGEDGDVLLALVRQRDEEDARERKRLRLIADANAQTTTVASLKAAAAAASKELKEAKAAVAAAESILETKRAMKTFALEDLGLGKKAAAGRQRGSAGSRCWIDWLASAMACLQHRKTISVGGRTVGMRKCWRSMATNGRAPLLNGRRSSCRT